MLEIHKSTILVRRYRFIFPKVSNPLKWARQTSSFSTQLWPQSGADQSLWKCVSKNLAAFVLQVHTQYLRSKFTTPTNKSAPLATALICDRSTQKTLYVVCLLLMLLANAFTTQHLTDSSAQETNRTQAAVESRTQWFIEKEYKDKCVWE